jgi:hypothetical protein
MTCPVCKGQGVVRVRYQDESPDDYGVCLCGDGLRLRVTRNANTETAYPLWLLWAAQRQIDQDHICRVEELLSKDELKDIPKPPDISTESDAIAAAMQTQKPRL